jgi:hypothetical protein
MTSTTTTDPDYTIEVEQSSGDTNTVVRFTALTRELQAIVRATAEQEDWVDNSWGRCRWCGSPFYYGKPETHQDGCPRRLAKELLARLTDEQGRPMITNANQALGRAARAAYQQAINDKSAPLSYCQKFYREVFKLISGNADKGMACLTFDFEKYLPVARDHDTGEVDPAQRALAHQITIACLVALQDMRGFWCRPLTRPGLFEICWSGDACRQEWERPVPFYLLTVGVLRAEWPE